jgi:hypothetical protein
LPTIRTVDLDQAFDTSVSRYAFQPATKPNSAPSTIVQIGNVSDDVRLAVQAALEKAGVEFIPENGGGRGSAAG